MPILTLIEDDEHRNHWSIHALAIITSRGMLLRWMFKSARCETIGHQYLQILTQLEYGSWRMNSDSRGRDDLPSPYKVSITCIHAPDHNRTEAIQTCPTTNINKEVSAIEAMPARRDKTPSFQKFVALALGIRLPFPSSSLHYPFHRNTH